ncbi:hypothetical protein Abr02nite_59440 [Paractinoplanes brasiliensis]|nr:hypothetical protein Abr02nite_59440 [Actinoplanes brasiliensis]
MASGHPHSDHQAARDHPRGQGHIGQHPPGPLALRRATGARKDPAPFYATHTLRGLPELYAATSGTHGSEVAPTQQRIGATRQRGSAAAGCLGRTVTATQWVYGRDSVARNEPPGRDRWFLNRENKVLIRPHTVLSRSASGPPYGRITRSPAATLRSPYVLRGRSVGCW